MLVGADTGSISTHLFVGTETMVLSGHRCNWETYADTGSHSLIRTSSYGSDTTVAPGKYGVPYVVTIEIVLLLVNINCHPFFLFFLALSSVS